MKHQNINEGADVVYALGHEIAEKYRRASVILHCIGSIVSLTSKHLNSEEKRSITRFTYCNCSNKLHS